MSSRDSLVSALRARLGKETVLDGLTDRLARAHDASIYRMVPRVVVRPGSIADIQAIFSICRSQRIGMTFRAAGTSLSGQAVTDGVLAELGPHWRRAVPSPDGSFISTEPGVIGGHLNALLARHRRRIGPDPASLASCMIGGIIANNASGMCCGTHSNAYQTLKSLKIVLADGYFLDTADPNADEMLRRDRPEVHRGLAELRGRILANPDLVAKIRRKYAIKNTMGYSLNAFLDFERPVAILEHLMVGSEGSLGFIAEATLRTIAENQFQATAIAYFAELSDAGAAVEGLTAAGAAVLEIMDRYALSALQAEMRYPFPLPPNCAALLIEIQENDRATFEGKLAAARAVLPRERLLAPLAFTQNPQERAHYWKLRKGLFPKVGAERRPGTAVIIEDICLPRTRLAEAITDLRSLFQDHGFAEAVIFGHAKDGNLHFVLCHDFSRAEAVTQYAGLMEALAELVVHRYEGSLKAEHGTGRNMAPFVKFEWGEPLYEIMLATKHLLDPQGILNPGVQLTPDTQAHLQNLKTLPEVASRVDQCIECGFCERVCPSRDLTLTPRQRIALQREIEQAGRCDRKSARAIQRRLRREFAYAGIQTCAGDGLCATVCPVGIDTGAYMRELKAQSHGRLANRVALFLAKNVGTLAVLARWGLRLSGLAGRNAPPLLALPAKSISSPIKTEHRPKVVYFSACLSKIMNSSAELASPTPDKTLALCGFEVAAAASGTACCGQAFLSKAYAPAARLAAENWIDLLWESSKGGAYPIVCDTSPCTARLHSLGTELGEKHRERWRKFEIFDFHSFMAKRVLPLRPSWPKLTRHLVLHPTCSSMKDGSVGDLMAVAQAFATEVSVPIAAGCCGFAGDKGFRVPELTQSATREEAAEVRDLVRSQAERGKPTFGYSTCQTCALGMSRSTGIAYRSIAQLCWEALQSGVPDGAPVV